MPPLEPRGRYLTREWFSDAELQTKTTSEVREFYLGLAQLADDKGWMPRDIVGIAAHLYRFRGIEEREALTRGNLDVLTRLAKVRSHRCRCLFLPTVAKTRRPGNISTVHFDEHQTHSNTASNRSNRVQTGSNTQPDVTSPDLTVAGADARSGAPRRGPMTRVGGSLPFAYEDVVSGKPS